jgi:hypothetical protein
MAGKRHTDPLKREAIKRVTEWDPRPAADVSRSLGVPPHGLYAWLRAAAASRSNKQTQQEDELEREDACPKSEPRR